MPDVMTNYKRALNNLRTWYTNNPGKDIVLCDMLDACHDITQRRALFASFSRDDQRGLLFEWQRRCTNRRAPVGALVCPKPGARVFNIYVTNETLSFSAVYAGLATVIGQVDNNQTRHLMLHTPWENLEGVRIVFAQARANELYDLTHEVESDIVD